jgi:hypothetical protein
VRRVMHKITACLLAATILPASLGLNMVPRPAPPGTAGDEDYPCKGHVCGCITAAICRTSCCCHPKEPSCCSGSSHAQPAVVTQGPPAEKPPRPTAELALRVPGCWGWDAWSFAKESTWLGPMPTATTMYIGIAPSASCEAVSFHSTHTAPDPPPPRPA